MTISKKLFLMVALGVGLSLQLNASEPNPDNAVLDFISYLKNIRKAASLNLARWMETTYATNPDLSDQLKNIVNTDDTVANKTRAITQLQNEQTAGKNKYSFSNISALAKTAAAFIVAVGVASYFYFAYPWANQSK